MKNLKYVAETLNLLQNTTKAENPKYPATQVIQMNMEIALVLAHFTLLMPAMYDTPMVSYGWL